VAAAPARPGDLLPVPAPGATPGRAPAKRGFFADLEPKYVAIGAAVVIVVLGFWYAILRDPGSSVDANRPSSETSEESGDGSGTNPIEAAENGAAAVELQTALATASNLALSSGGYQGVRLDALAAAEPAITFVPQDQPAGPGEVSVRIVDPQSIVMVTSTEDGSCRAVYQSPPGSIDLIPPPPCAAASVSIGGEGRGVDEQVP
jgi:hypothetical protein